MPYGWKIKAILEEEDMSQAELSRLSGIEPSNISHIIKSNRNVREKTLSALCKGLGCKPEEIMLED